MNAHRSNVVSLDVRISIFIGRNKKKHIINTLRNKKEKSHTKNPNTKNCCCCSSFFFVSQKIKLPERKVFFFGYKFALPRRVKRSTSKLTSWQIEKEKT